MDAQWIEVEAVVRSTDGAHLLMICYGREVMASIGAGAATVVNGLVDAAVRARGVGITALDDQGRIQGIHLLIPSLEHVEILEPPRDPFSLPVQPIGNLLRLTVTLDDTTRTATMEVTNLTAGGTVVDLNGAAAGTSFSHTWSAAHWISPPNFAGTLGRAPTTLLIDNIVVLEPAILAPVVLQFQSVGTNLQLTWSQGTLLEATSVLGAWTTNLATSPMVIAPTQPQRFYRVQLR